MSGAIGLATDRRPKTGHLHRRNASERRRHTKTLQREIHGFGAGVGVATGEVVSGDVGHASRLEHTAIGNAVSSAPRLTDLA